MAGSMATAPQLPNFSHCSRRWLTRRSTSPSRSPARSTGGVNEKIEGFFDACRITGFTGRQGVIIPASNVKHLMLRQDVVTAAAEKQFRIFPIETVDQGLALLTGVPAGEAGEGGTYPAGTINHSIAARLDTFAAKAAELARNTAIAQSHS
jgi:hypothetical protein